MKLRPRNPTPLQWSVILGAGALTLGLSAAAYAATRKTDRVPLPDLPDVSNDEDPPWEVVTPKDPGYPWEFPALHIDNYPTPATWWNAGDKTGSFDPSDGYDRLVQAVLGSALAMAGVDPSLALAEGKKSGAELGRRLRRAVREAIMAIDGVNDLLYGQQNLNFAGGNDPSMPGGDPNRPISAAYVMNERGRGLNWLPRHADNLSRIAARHPLRRTTDLQGQALPNSSHRQMLIWIPAFDLDALARDVPSIQPLAWSNGTSTLNPPPSIQEAGIDMSGVEL